MPGHLNLGYDSPTFRYNESKYTPDLFYARPKKVGFSKGRTSRLSKPRKTKQIWQTKFGPARLVWGDQTMMNPISEASLRAKATPRLMKLSQPKKSFLEGRPVDHRFEYIYSCGRPSTIWEVTKEALHARSTARIQRLAQPKRVNEEYVKKIQYPPYGCGRESTIWNIRPAALKCKERPRTIQLAKPKGYHPDYVPDRIEAKISISSMAANSSQRINELSKPRLYKQSPCNEDIAFADPAWKVSEAALNYKASSRVSLISQPTPYAKGYEPSRYCTWIVSPAAMKAVTTQRMVELSKPVPRKGMDTVQFNHDAFTVKPHALQAKCSPRIEQLALPSGPSGR